MAVKKTPIKFLVHIKVSDVTRLVRQDAFKQHAAKERKRPSTVYCGNVAVNSR